MLNAAAVVAAFAVSVAFVLTVFGLRPAPLHEGDAWGVSVTALPDDATAGELADALSGAANTVAGSLIRPDVARGDDVYLYLGAEPSGSPRGYAEPGFDPGFAPLDAASAIDLGGLWTLYSPTPDAGAAFEAAACIGCGACVAACPNASAMLFTGAKISHLGLLPQGQPERLARVVSMLNQHDAEGFGGCTNIGECAAVCPKSVPLEVISRLNRDLGHALWKGQHAH